MNPTVIHMVDSEGNAAQLKIAPEVIELGFAGGANQSGISNPALDDITDVVLTSVSDGQVLTYDSATGKWVNEAAGSSSADSFARKLAIAALSL